MSFDVTATKNKHRARRAIFSQYLTCPVRRRIATSSCPIVEPHKADIAAGELVASSTMPKRKAAASAPTEIEPTAVPLPAQTTSENPSTLRYLVLVFSSFALSVAARTFSSYFVEGDLASVTRTIDDWPQISGFLGGRAVELALGWWGRYDGKAMMRTDVHDRELILSQVWTWQR